MIADSANTQAFYREGDSDIAVLMIHGFTGSPASMRPWGDFLHDHGHSVSGPRLPGHGTHWQDLAKTTWQEWYAQVDESFQELTDKHRLVFVAGISMGVALGLRLAQDRGEAVGGLMAVNPAVRRPERLDVPVLLAVNKVGLLNALAQIMPTVSGVKNDINKPGQDSTAYEQLPIKGALQLIKLQDDIGADLASVTQPMVVFTSITDHVVEPANSQMLMSEVGSQYKTQIMLPDSYHVATLDHDAQEIFQESLQFIERHS